MISSFFCFSRGIVTQAQYLFFVVAGHHE